MGAADKIAKKLSYLIKQNEATVAKAIPLPARIKSVNHVAPIDSRQKIAKEGLRPAKARWSPEDIRLWNEELDLPLNPVDHAFDYVYASKHGNPEQFAPGVSFGEEGRRSFDRYKIDLTDPKLRQRVVYDPNTEGGLVYIRGGVPKKATSILKGKEWKRLAAILAAFGGMDNTYVEEEKEDRK
jgi:hypothetical protein